MEVLGLKEPNGISSGSTQTLATINSNVFLRILGRADAYLPLKIGLWICGPTAGNNPARKGAHHSLTRPWKLGQSTGAVTDREERPARRAKGRQKFKRCAG
jgi:hypothetical protein